MMAKNNGMKAFPIDSISSPLDIKMLNKTIEAMMERNLAIFLK